MGDVLGADTALAPSPIQTSPDPDPELRVSAQPASLEPADLGNSLSYHWHRVVPAATSGSSVMATLWSFDRGPGSLVHGAGGSAFWDASQVETQVRTPQMVFMQPQRLIVPLFQRPYVWNEEKQWEPLWGDVTRVAQRLLAQPQARHQPHFLGAVVLQQVLNPAGSMQERTVIDGQQRLTTLQLLLDALHAELHTVGAVQPAMRIEALVKNAEPFWEDPADRFKVWPTNRDRPAFNCVMGAEPPVNYSGLEHSGARLVEGHRYFAERAREWLQVDGPDQVQTRASYLERSVRELLQVVVIDLTVEENAQEIFETLNARGAQLTAADLIKNFIFQRLIESGEAVESAYEQYWKVFETGFWEMEISFGRVRYARSSAFLNQWLIARTGEEIVAREVFSRFKQYADFDSGVRMGDLLAQIHRAAGVYRRFVQASETLTGPIDRVDLFAYRTSVLESEVIKPLALFLLDPEQEQRQRLDDLALKDASAVREQVDSVYRPGQGFGCLHEAPVDPSRTMYLRQQISHAHARIEVCVLLEAGEHFPRDDLLAGTSYEPLVEECRGAGVADTPETYFHLPEAGFEHFPVLLIGAFDRLPGLDEALEDEVLDKVSGCELGSTCIKRLEDLLRVLFDCQINDHDL